MSNLRKFSIRILLFVAIVSSLYIATVIRAYLNRPLFHNTFGFPENRVPFPRWSPDAISQLDGSDGQLVFADFGKNVLLVIETHDPSYSQEWMPSISGTTCSYATASGDVHSLEITDNSLIVWDKASGASRRSTLRGGDAKEWFKRVEALPLDKQVIEIRKLFSPSAQTSS